MHNNIYIIKTFASKKEAYEWWFNNDVDDEFDTFDEDFFVYGVFDYYRHRFGVDYIANEYDNNEEAYKSFLEDFDGDNIFNLEEDYLFSFNKEGIRKHLSSCKEKLKEKLLELSNNLDEENVCNVESEIALCLNTYGDSLFYDTDSETMLDRINFFSNVLKDEDKNYFVLINILDYHC